MNANGLRIKVLEKLIKKNGYLYHLVQRDDRKAIYKQEKYGYEVFRVRKSKPHPKSEDNIKNFDLIEGFPTDEDFGKRAWHYKTLEDAKRKYELI